jgi:hypothetical protein
MRQQADMGKDIWWDKYLHDEVFRLEQEVEAYRAQYQYIVLNGNRKDKREMLQHITSALSSRLYGGMITKRHAQLLIEG